MKDAKQEQLEACRPSSLRMTPLECVEYCLKKLFADKQHKCLDEISPDLTYEEVIGGLLVARDLLTTGTIAKQRGRKYFSGVVVKVFDSKGNIVKVSCRR